MKLIELILQFYYCQWKGRQPITQISLWNCNSQNDISSIFLLHHDIHDYLYSCSSWGEFGFPLFPCLKIFIYFVTTLSPSIMVEGKWRCVKDSWQGKDGCSAIQNLSNYFGVSIIGGKQISIIQFHFSVSKLKKKVWIFEMFLHFYM